MRERWYLFNAAMRMSFTCFEDMRTKLSLQPDIFWTSFCLSNRCKGYRPRTSSACATLGTAESGRPSTGQGKEIVHSYDWKCVYVQTYCMYVCVCMYCTYVCMDTEMRKGCMYVCMYVCVWMYAHGEKPFLPTVDDLGGTAHLDILMNHAIVCCMYVLCMYY